METHETIHLRVGEAHDVALPGLGTAGYVWRSEPGAGTELTVEKRERSGEPADGAAGASSGEVFRIRALQPGQVRIRFVQSRPWEQAVSPLNEHIVEVTVEPPER
jgi:predicted secreted protein